MIVRSLFPLLLALAGLSIFLSPASAQNNGAATTTSAAGPVIVYRLTFEVTGETINFRPFQNGYYVAPVQGGVGTLILTRQTGNEKSYYTYNNFGELFLAKNGSKRKAVISATTTSTGSSSTNANAVSTTTLFAIGDASETKELDTAAVSGDVYFADELTGYAVSADSETDLPFSGSGSDIGVAGATALLAKLDQSRTDAGQKQNFTVLEAVTALIADLTESGYTDGLATRP